MGGPTLRPIPSISKKVFKFIETVFFVWCRFYFVFLLLLIWLIWLPFDCRLIAVWPNNPFDSFQTDIDKDELTEMIQAISNLAREIDAWNRLMPS